MVNEFQSHSTHLKRTMTSWLPKKKLQRKKITSAFLSYILENERLEHFPMEVGKMIVLFNWVIFRFHPIGSMYGIFPYIYHKNQPNVGKYTIHGSYWHVNLPGAVTVETIHPPWVELHHHGANLGCRRWCPIFLPAKQQDSKKARPERRLQKSWLVGGFNPSEKY